MTATLLFCAMELGLLPDGYRERLEARARLCETIAMQFCTLLPQEQIPTFDRLAPLLVHRNPDLLSLAIRDSEGHVIASTSEHARLWQSLPAEVSLETHVQVPIYADDQPSGAFEICLEPIYANDWERALQQMHLPLVAFCVGAGFLIFRFYLKKTLKRLDPGSVVPGRVNTVLDILSDGVVVTDEKGQIVLANEAFQKATGQPAQSFLGKSLSILKWIDATGNTKTEDLPWSQVLQNGSIHRSVPLRLEHTHEAGQYHNFLVSVTPIAGAEGENRGMLVSFTDVPELERDNCEQVEVSRLADKAQIDTDTRPDVGNVLNRFNVSTTRLPEKLTRSKSSKLQDVVRMISDHHDDPGHFLTKDKRGKHIPATLIKMIDLLIHEQTGSAESVSHLADQLKHFEEIAKNQPFTSDATEQAVERSRNVPQIWQPGSAIFGGETDPKETTGPDAAQALFEAKQTEILANTQIQLPQLGSHDALMIMKETEGLWSLQSEGQNEPIDPSHDIIRRNDFVSRDDPHDLVANLLAMLDDKIRSLGASDPSEATARILSCTEIHQFEKFSLESNTFQVLMAQVLEPTVRHGNLRFCRSHQLPLDPPKQSSRAQNDDGPDAQEAQRPEARRMHDTPTVVQKSGNEGDIGHAGGETKQINAILENLLSPPYPLLSTVPPARTPSPKSNKESDKKAGRPQGTTETKQVHPTPDNVPSPPAPFLKKVPPAHTTVPKSDKKSDKKAGRPQGTAKPKLTRRGRGVLNSSVRKYIQDRGNVPGITWKDVVTAINTMDLTRHAPTSRRSVEKTVAWREYLSSTSKD